MAAQTNTKISYESGGLSIAQTYTPDDGVQHVVLPTKREKGVATNTMSSPIKEKHLPACPSPKALLALQRSTAVDGHEKPAIIVLALAPVSIYAAGHAIGGDPGPIRP